MDFREENSSKIETLSLNSQPRFRNYRMKLIVWMIREIFNVLNQYAVDNPTLPVNQRFFPLFQDPGGMLNRSLGMPSRNDRPPSIWDTHCISGSVFANPTASSSAPNPQESNPWVSNVTEHTSPHVMSGSQTPVRTVSEKFIRPQWGKIFKKFLGRPTTTADFGSSFWQIPHASNFCLLEDKIQDWGMYLFTISYGSYAMDQRSGDGWISGWSQIFAFYQRNSWAKLWVTRRKNYFSTEQNHPEYPLQEKGQPGGNESSKRRPLPPIKTDRLPDLRVLPGHWCQRFCRELCRPIHNCSSKWWYSGIRFEMGRNFIINDANPIWWHLGRIVQTKNTRVWETQDRVGSVEYGDSLEESWTWSSQIEDNGEKKYRAESTTKNFWSQKWKLWEERRGQESGNKTAWTKNSWRSLAVESQRAMF